MEALLPWSFRYFSKGNEASETTVRLIGRYCVIFDWGIEWGTLKVLCHYAAPPYWALGLKRAPNYLDFSTFMHEAFRHDIRTHNDVLNKLCSKNVRREKVTIVVVCQN